MNHQESKRIRELYNTTSQRTISTLYGMRNQLAIHATKDVNYDDVLLLKGVIIDLTRLTEALSRGHTKTPLEAKVLEIMETVDDAQVLDLYDICKNISKSYHEEPTDRQVREEILAYYM